MSEVLGVWGYALRGLLKFCADPITSGRASRASELASPEAMYAAAECVEVVEGRGQQFTVSS